MEFIQIEILNLSTIKQQFYILFYQFHFWLNGYRKLQGLKQDTFILAWKVAVAALTKYHLMYISTTSEGCRIFRISFIDFLSNFIKLAFLWLFYTFFERKEPRHLRNWESDYPCIYPYSGGISIIVYSFMTRCGLICIENVFEGSLSVWSNNIKRHPASSHVRCVQAFALAQLNE